MHINELNRQIISQLEQENNDLKNPLKPHLIKLDMQTKQVEKKRKTLLIEVCFVKKNAFL